MAGCVVLVIVAVDVNGEVVLRRFRALLPAAIAAAVLATAVPAAASVPASVPASAAGGSAAHAGRPIAAAVGDPVPAGFRAQSVSWPTPADGWVLGAAPCPAGECTAVAHTADGGSRWSLVAAPPLPLAPSGENGVTGIRFADPRHGWAFGPALFATSDGGASWQSVRLPGGGRQVLALAAGGDAVYLATSVCDLGKECTRAPTVWRAAVPGTSWLPVPARLPGNPTQVVLAARGSVVYVLGTQVPPDPDAFFVGTDDGRRWSARPSPCDKAQDQALVDVVPVSDTAVALLCVGDPGRSRAVKHVFRSPDTGLSVVDAGTTDTLGIQSRLAATAGTLLVTSRSSGDWLYRSVGGGKWAAVLDLADGGVGWNDPVFSAGQTAWVVYGPAAEAPDLPGGLLQSTDAGLTWTPVTFSR